MKRKLKEMKEKTSEDRKKTERKQIIAIQLDSNMNAKTFYDHYPNLILV